MSWVPDDSAPNGATCNCDRCGEDCGDGSITNCIVLTDFDPNPALVNIARNYHFCRANGCSNKLMTSTNMAWYRKNQKSTEAADPAPTADAEISA